MVMSQVSGAPTRARVLNTVEVDETEQSEVWSAFRVGRRARQLGARLADEVARFEGAHDATGICGRVVHRRVLDVGADFAVRVGDTLSGAGEHRAVAWYHCEPGLELRAAEDGYQVCDGAGTPLAIIDGIVADEVEVRITPRYPAFGCESTGASLALRRAGRLPLDLGCSIRPVGRSSSDCREGAL